MRNTIPCIVLLGAAILSAACKKDSSTTTLPSMSGLIITDPAPFVEIGSTQTFTVDVSDLLVSDNTDPGVLGAYWQVNSGVRDTTTRDVAKSNPPYTVDAPKEGTYSVTASVYAVKGGYYNAAISVSFEAINPKTALTGRRSLEVESVEGKNIMVTDRNTHRWMAENRYGTVSGRDYRDCTVVSDLFGRYYTWEEAQTACPEGWRLPTAAEFDEDLGDTAGDLMVDAKFLKKAMWAYWPQVIISNKLFFNAIPTGYVDLTTQQEVFGYKEYALWWTSDQDGDLGVYRYIYQEEPVIKKGKGSKTSLALNVRCIRDL